MIALIDNYDSFTYNLYQYLCELTDEPVEVIRNDRASVAEIVSKKPSRIVISPGPGRPEDAGISLDLIREFAGKVPVLGVCLGHQAIAQAFGARIVQAGRIVHGKAEPIRLDGNGLFRTLPTPATFTRYHSLSVDAESLPEEFEVTARSEDGEIMGIRHREYVMEGVQFHPESMASESGKQLLKNFLAYKREPFPVSGLLSGLIAGKHLSRDEASDFMEELTDGNLTPAQIAAFLVAISANRPSPEEIAGCAHVLQKKRIPVQLNKPALDTCGTGGDGLGTFNISSMSALAAAACGVTVAKHGNRAVSSKSGSADFYRELGIVVDLSPDQTASLINETGFGFLFAPIYHGAMRFAAPPRRELGIKTIMNLLGPLVNPAGARYQLIGVYSEEYVDTMAQAAHMLGIKRVRVVHGSDGIDEISVSAPTQTVLLSDDGTREEQVLTPEDLGIRRHSLDDLAGGDAAHNANLARDLLAGRGSDAIRDAVSVNAGAALSLYDPALDLVSATARIRTAFEDGTVRDFVDRVVERSGELAREKTSDPSQGGSSQ